MFVGRLVCVVVLLGRVMLSCVLVVLGDEGISLIGVVRSWCIRCMWWLLLLSCMLWMVIVLLSCVLFCFSGGFILNSVGRVGSMLVLMIMLWFCCVSGFIGLCDSIGSGEMLGLWFLISIIDMM